MVSSSVFRFAPSPNGLLHLGHALSALFSYKVAQAAGGQFLVRIEDFDRLRSRRDYIEQIFDDLKWLGLKWPEPVRYQSDHMADYANALSTLKNLGVTYKCYATRREVRLAAAGIFGDGNEPRDPDGALVYPGIDRNLTADDIAQRTADGKPSCVRLDMKKAMALIGQELTFSEYASGPEGQNGRIICHPEAWGDVIIARKDVPASYHLSVVVDDAQQGITHVTRGQDLFHATSVHRVLQNLLNLPQPDYSHHQLVLGRTGRKLAKSAEDKSLKSLREEGLTLASLYDRFKTMGLQT